jgi:hypothetical protein
MVDRKASASALVRCLFLCWVRPLLQRTSCRSGGVAAERAWLAVFQGIWNGMAVVG